MERLAIQYSNLGETALSRQSAIRAYQARERASGPEKFNIEYSYHRNVTGNLEKAWQSISLWRQTYPRDPKAFSLSGGYAANGTGRLEQVVELTEKSIALEPDQLYGYTIRRRLFFIWGDLMKPKKRLPSLPRITRLDDNTGRPLPSRVVETGSSGYGEIVDGEPGK